MRDIACHMRNFHRCRFKTFYFRPFQATVVVTSFVPVLNPHPKSTKLLGESWLIVCKCYFTQQTNINY